MTAHLPATHKRCSCCHEVKPVEEFGVNCQTPDGLMYYCRTCNCAKQREYREQNPDKAKASRDRYLAKLRARNREARRAKE